MAENICPQCGAPNALDSRECKYCGEDFAVKTGYTPPVQQRPPLQHTPPPAYQQPPVPPNNYHYQQMINDGINPAWPIKSKIAAGLLGIFLGGLGIHKFYMGKIGMGIIYLLFSWTLIPGFIALIEGIIYLCSNEHNFQIKHKVRTR